MLQSVKLTGVATATAQHCNKAVNLKAKPLTRPDSQPKGTSGEPECPAGPRLEQMNWREEHSLWARGLSNHSHHMPPGGVREQGKRGGRGGGEVHLLQNTNPSLSTCPGGSLTTATNRHTHTSPVSQDHRNSICPALISTRPYSRNTPDPSSSPRLPLQGKRFSELPTTIRPMMSKC